MAVFCMRCADSAIAALILGMSPVTIAFYGNWKENECSFSSLIWPSLAMTAGLVVVNIPPMQESFLEGSLGIHCLGLLSGFGALASWSLYAVLNGHLLRHDRAIHAGDWCCVLGIATLAWVLLTAVVLIVCVPGHHIQKYVVYTPELQAYLIGSLILGLMCSWLGFFLWNKGSSLLPVSLAGQLTIFETLFGLLYIFIVDRRLPSIIECCGITLMLGGIFAGVRNFKELPAPDLQPSGDK